ncbi:hypothetical protein GCM10010216_21960 [Streptomyces flaveolus]|nr:hypothetical protein GCM10010216_21960 [Streptomyces flaveolus]
MIKGYGVHLHLGRLGLGLRAHVAAPPAPFRPERAEPARPAARHGPRPVVCPRHRGELLRADGRGPGAQHLEQVIEDLAEMGDTTTGVVLSEPVHPRDVDIAAWLLPED